MAITPPVEHWIASRTILAAGVEGRKFPLTLRIGLPVEAEPGLWGCAVRLEGLHDVPLTVYGIDAWQALQLGWQLVAQLLQDFIAQGGRLMWLDERATLSLAELIPQLDSPTS